MIWNYSGLYRILLIENIKFSVRGENYNVLRKMAYDNETKW